MTKFTSHYNRILPYPSYDKPSVIWPIFWGNLAKNVNLDLWEVLTRSIGQKIWCNKEFILIIPHSVSILSYLVIIWIVLIFYVPRFYGILTSNWMFCIETWHIILGTFGNCGVYWKCFGFHLTACQTNNEVYPHFWAPGLQYTKKWGCAI